MDESADIRVPDGAQQIGLGNILVAGGFITRGQLEQALFAQQEARVRERRNLRDALFKPGLLSFYEISRIARALGYEQKLVRRLMAEKKLDRETYIEVRTGDSGSIIEELVARGIVSGADLVSRYGLAKVMEYALKNGLISSRACTAAGLGATPMLGEILLSLGYLDQAELMYILDKYKKRKKIGALLVESGRLSSEHLATSLRERGRAPVRLGEYLLQKGVISSEDLLQVLSRHFNVPVYTLRGQGLDHTKIGTLRSAITLSYAKQHQVVPLTVEGEHLTLGLWDPAVLRDHMNLNLGTYKKVDYALMPELDFRLLFKELYGMSFELKERPRKSVEVDFLDMSQEEEAGTPTSAETTPVEDFQDMQAAELLNRIIKYGVKIGASDIHIDQDYQSVKLRYRVDGVLNEPTDPWLTDLLQEKVHAAVSRIKIMAKMDIAERRIPQDGAFRMSFVDHKTGEKVMLVFRVGVCRASVGENVSIRILDSRKANLRLDDLGISPDTLDTFKKALHHPAGMILLTGPTGSGKTTTLYAAIQYIYTPAIKIITAEDPIEYNFPGIMQTQVNPKIDLGFPRLLRSFLRLDPDVILVGEVRDTETAEIAFNAAQTGHLLLSTLHTNDSFGSLVRLRDLGLEAGDIAASLKAVLAQRLLRYVCPDCKEEYRPARSEWSEVFVEYPKDIQFFRGTGCPSCRYTGYKGRGAVTEMFVVDERIQSLVSRRTDMADIRKAAISHGMRTMVMDAVSKLDKTSLAEIIRVVPRDMIETFRAQSKQAE